MKTKTQIEAEINRNTAKIGDLQKQITDLTALNTELQAALVFAPDEDVAKKYIDSQYGRTDKK